MHQGSQRQQFFICSIIMIVWKVIIAVWIWNNHHNCVESLDLEKVCEKTKLETEMKKCTTQIIIRCGKSSWQIKSESKIKVKMRITYTRDSLQLCNIRDSKPKQKVHEDKRHEQNEDQEKHLVLTTMQ